MTTAADILADLDRMEPRTDSLLDVGCDPPMPTPGVDLLSGGAPAPTAPSDAPPASATLEEPGGVAVDQATQSSAAMLMRAAQQQRRLAELLPDESARAEMLSQAMEQEARAAAILGKVPAATQAATPAAVAAPPPMPSTAPAYAPPPPPPPPPIASTGGPSAGGDGDSLVSPPASGPVVRATLRRDSGGRFQLLLKQSEQGIYIARLPPSDAGDDRPLLREGDLLRTVNGLNPQVMHFDDLKAYVRDCPGALHLEICGVARARATAAAARADIWRVPSAEAGEPADVVEKVRHVAQSVHRGVDEFLVRPRGRHLAPARLPPSAAAPASLSRPPSIGSAPRPLRALSPVCPLSACPLRLPSPACPLPPALSACPLALAVGADTLRRRVAAHDTGAP